MIQTYKMLIVWGMVCLFAMLVVHLSGIGNKLFSLILFLFLGGYILMLMVGFWIVQRKEKKKKKEIKKHG